MLDTVLKNKDIGDNVNLLLYLLDEESVEIQGS